jgi:hypothetical protein
MELEFDKEIDAILRKGRDARGVLVGDNPPEPKKHLDADAIAAFAENALPVPARLLYTEHLAHCDPCRRKLSSAIRMNREADAAAASTVSAPIAAAAVPWYSRLFRTPSLAVAMGSLVLVLSAALGYLVLQRQSENAANNAIVSQATAPDAGSAPYYKGEPAANTDAAPAANIPGNSTAQPPAGSAGSTAANTAPGGGPTDPAKPQPPAEDKEAAEGRRNFGIALDGVTTTVIEPQPAAPAAAMRSTADQPKTERDEMLAAADDAKDKGGAGRRDADSRAKMDREAAPEALKKVGPSRAGPLNTQQQMNSNIGEMSVTRSVGGKTFFNRNGAWVDTVYSGQTVTLVRRGSGEFKKLDSGLRSIANDLYGTVIVLWKGKAYRIV